MSDESKVYIEVHKDGRVFDVDTLNALQGFAHLPYRIEYVAYDWRTAVLTGDNPFAGMTRLDVAVGDVRLCRAAMVALGVDPPKLPDYPDALSAFLGRCVRRMSTSEAFKLKPPFFIKPVACKLWTGYVIRVPSDWDKIAQHIDSEVDCLVSDPVEFATEYRVFVHGREIVGAKHYSGDFRLMPQWERIDDAVKMWVDSPIAYGIDFGLTTDGRTLLIEVNDMYSLGSYDLNSIVYAKALEARWREIVGG